MIPVSSPDAGFAWPSSGTCAPLGPGDDLTAPVDDLHVDCVALQRIIHAGFAREAESIARRADSFAADIERLVAGADGWEPAVRLAHQDPA